MQTQYFHNSEVSASYIRDLAILGILGVLLAMLLLSGCASVGPSDAGDATQYNQITDYPAVGGVPRRL